LQRLLPPDSEPVLEAAGNMRSCAVRGDQQAGRQGPRDAGGGPTRAPPDIWRTAPGEHAVL